MRGSLNIGIEEKESVVKKRQTTEDIAKYLLIAERDSRKYYPELKKYFDTGNDLETAGKIHQYTRDNLVYDKEKPSNQIVRTAPRVIHDIYVDCKGYSTFILASLRACGINAWYRLAGYKVGSKIPTHVYCVAEIDGEEVVIDGTVKYFDWEAPAVCRYNIHPITNKNMALSYFQGVGNIGRRSKSERKKSKSEKKQKRQKKREEKKKDRPTKRRRIAKVAAAPARAAFIAIVRLNGFNLATKLAKAINLNRTKVSQFWAKFGGNFDELIKEVNKKSGEPAISEPITITSSLAFATPILIAVGTLMKEMNLFSKDEGGALDAAIDEGAELLEENEDVEKSEVDFPDGERVAKVKKKKSTTEPDVDLPEGADDDDEDETEGEGKGDMLLPIGLGLLAIMMFSKN